MQSRHLRLCVVRVPCRWTNTRVASKDNPRWALHASIWDVWARLITVRLPLSQRLPKSTIPRWQWWQNSTPTAWSGIFSMPMLSTDTAPRFGVLSIASATMLALLFLTEERIANKRGSPLLSCSDIRDILAKVLPSKQTDSAALEHMIADRHRRRASDIERYKRLSPSD